MPDDRLPTPAPQGPGSNAALPHNIEAEQFLLGAVLLDNDAIERIDAILKPEHFYDPVHARIYEVIKRNVDRGLLADPVVLKAHFQSEGTLDELGGEAYLRELAASVPNLAHVADYARAIFETFQRRGLVRIGNEVAANALDEDVDNTPRDQIEAAEQELYSLAETGKYGAGFVNFNTAATEALKVAEEAFKRDSHVSGVSTGLIDLDKRLGGLQKSDLIIIAARPGMGKSALALNIAFNAARKAHEAQRLGQVAEDGAVTAFFSLEMSAPQLAQRILSSESGVPADRVRRGDIEAHEYDDIADTLALLQDLPLYIDETGALSIAALGARARRLKRQEGLGLLVVDYVQLMTASGKKRTDNRVQEVTEITTGLKALAKELDIPIIACAQLSRQVESRDDKRPQLSDLRESGSIEQDADIVMFIYRDDYYLKNREPPQGSEEHLKWLAEMEAVHGQAEVIIAKQRHGPTGTVPLAFNGPLTKFGDLERASYDIHD